MRVTVHRSPALSAADLDAIRAARLGELLRRSGEALGVASRAGVALRLTGDLELRTLNARHAGDDEATDVLSFPGGGAWVGDIAISVERARAQNPGDPGAELRLLAIHGLLHCLGHDHHEPGAAARMQAATRRLLPDQPVPDLLVSPP
jgi:probable rRNA maturation factor